MPDSLRIVAENPILYEELRKFLLSKFELDTIPDGTDNAQLGEIVRARLDGRLIVDEAFRQIAGLKIEKPRVAENPAR